MANKFFGLFDINKDGLQKQFDELNKKLSDALNVDVDIQGINEKGDKITDLGVRMKRTAEQIIETSRQIREAMDLNDEEAVRGLKRRREALVEDQTANDLEHENLKKKVIAEEKNTKSLSERLKVNSLTQKSTEAYHSSLSALNESFVEGKVRANEMEEALRDLETKNKVDSIIEGFDSVFDIKKLGGKIAAGIGELKSPIAKAFAVMFNKAWDQMLEVNDILVDLERNTGGVIQAKDQGSDVFGNSREGFRSLTSELAGSNLTVGEYKNALVDLSKEGFGQTIGVMQDLNGSSKELKEFGIEASRLGKLYGTNIAPSVRNLIQNFGSSIEGATKTMKEGADSAKSLGLNVDFYVKNFEQVTSLIGDIYFRSEENMKSLALFATQLGTSAGALAKGFIPMKGINDLFQKQQETLAFGLERTAATMAQVYALNKTGQGDKAVKLQAASLALDIDAMGGIDKKTKTLNSAGIETLEQMGLGKEMRESINKLTIAADKYNVNIMDYSLGNLSKEKQLEISQDENKNMKLTEQFANMGTLFYATIVDPLTAIVGPVVKLFGNLLEGLIKVVGFLVSVFYPIFEGIGEVFSFLSDQLIHLYAIVGEVMKVLGVDLKSGINGFHDALKVMGVAIGIVLTALGIFSAKLIASAAASAVSSIAGAIGTGATALGVGVALTGGLAAGGGILAMATGIGEIALAAGLVYGAFKLLTDETEDATEAEKQKRLELEKHGRSSSLIDANLTPEEYKRIAPTAGEQWEQNRRANETAVKAVGNTIQEQTKVGTKKGMEEHYEKTFMGEKEKQNSKPVAQLKLSVQTDGMYNNSSQISQTLLFS